jgi:membrane associated rhomboid family serine protease
MPHPPTGRSTRRHWAATLVLATATAVLGVLALHDPGVLGVLRRDLTGLRAGQWWRLVTPLLVQPAGWGQYGFNLLGIVLVGLAVERRYRSVRMLLIYLLAGAAGIGAALLWAPHDVGGGASDAVAGLIGAATVAYWVDRRPPWRVTVWYAVFFPVYLTTLDALGMTASVVAGSASVAVVSFLLSAGRVGAARRLTMLAVLFGAAAMTLLWDPHGIGLLIGLLAGSVLLPRQSPQPAPVTGAAAAVSRIAGRPG